MAWSGGQSQAVEEFTHEEFDLPLGSPLGITVAGLQDIRQFRSVGDTNFNVASSELFPASQDFPAEKTIGYFFDLLVRHTDSFETEQKSVDYRQGRKSPVWRCSQTAAISSFSGALKSTGAILCSFEFRPQARTLASRRRLVCRPRLRLFCSHGLHFFVLVRAVFLLSLFLVWHSRAPHHFTLQPCFPYFGRILRISEFSHKTSWQVIDDTVLPFGPVFALR